MGSGRNAARHPVDSIGLVLPEPSWPDRPGGAGVLEPLRRFCNTVNRENGADAWRTPAELRDWLAREGYGHVAPVNRRVLTRLAELRESLWRGISTRDYSAFAETAGVLVVRVEATDRGAVLVPARVDADTVVAQLALAVTNAAAGGRLERLKACEHCRWVFHDLSRNRRGRWCSMAACGNRNKAREYRRRRAAAASTTRGTSR